MGMSTMERGASSMRTDSERALGVSDAMVLAKTALERVRLRVVGEVSEATIKPGYKAVYFSLKDVGAVMPCLMWRDTYDASGVRLADGQLVEVTGYFTAYLAKGRLQFQVQSVTIAGEGALRLQVAALARALEAEGLMSPARKRKLPQFPERIGVVTSPRGKAVHDVLRTLRRRYPLAEVVVAGVQVEGEGAVQEIVRGIRLVCEQPDIDVLIVGRGGGSYEDLMPFNSEEVARAIAASPVPVVTGIGHEPDTSIADMVADVRASTPTAAAEAVSPGTDEVRRRLSQQSRALGRALGHVARGCEHRLELVRQRPVFSDTTVVLGSRMQAIDALTGTLSRALPGMLERKEFAVVGYAERLHRGGLRLLEPWEKRLGADAARTAGLGREIVAQAERDVRGLAARLEDLSPLAILARGYAVCYASDGTVVRAAGSISAGERVSVRLAAGTLGCVVEEVETEA